MQQAIPSCALTSRQGATPKPQMMEDRIATRGVMIPFFSRIGIGIGSGPQEPESESHGIDSKMESIPRLESVPYLESNPSMELIPPWN